MLDLTYPQFKNKSDQFNKLYTYGYQYIDNNDFNHYLNIVSTCNLKTQYNLDEVFYDLQHLDNIQR